MADSRAQGKASSEPTTANWTQETAPGLEHNREEPGIKVE